MSGQQPPPDPWHAPAGADQPPPGPPPAPPPPPWGGQPYPPQPHPPQPYPPSYPPQPYRAPYPYPGQPYPGWYGPGGWSPAPKPRREPPKPLYAIPLVLILGPMVALTSFFLTRADELGIANQSDRVGRTDTGVSLRVKPGWHYDVYLPDTSDQPTVDACTFHLGTGDADASLDTSTGGTDFYTDDLNRDWVMVGSVTAPAGATGQARLTCTGFTGPLDVNADSSMFGWMILVILLSGLSGLAAVVVLVLLLVFRGRARGQQGAPRPPAPGYGYTGW